MILGYLNLASVRLCTESEGPGKRFAIWTQGCERRCLDCCNVEMQEIRKNKIVDVIDVIKLIEHSVEEYEIEGISLIGGEPILQAQGLAELAKWCQAHNLSVLMFTGYLYEELLQMENEYVKKLLKYTDILIDGPFLKEQYDEERDWVGSKNQNVIFLSEKYEQGIEFQNHLRSMELFVSNQEVLINGWPF